MENKSRKICVAVLLAMSICCFLYGCCQKFYFSTIDTTNVENQKADTLVVVDSNTIIVECCCDKGCKKDSPDTPSDSVSVLSLIVNFMNNNMFYISLYLALMTIVIGIMELLGVRKAEKYEKKIAEYRQETDTKIAEFERKIDDCLKTTEEIRRNHAKIENKQSLSNLYMQRINQWMYENTNNIAQVNSSESAKNSMNKAFLNYYLMKLHLCDDKTGIDECISRIKQKGGEDEIKALQLIVDNDMNKYKKEKAIEAIGYISGRLS
ncbi:MAG: hypothetical protein MJ001_02210 [Paludibacteraceae bacterium]|nr:hypothetical protein [Paludibacteraceae bacterium]